MRIKPIQSEIVRLEASKAEVDSDVDDINKQIKGLKGQLDHYSGVCMSAPGGKFNQNDNGEMTVVWDNDEAACMTETYEYGPDHDPSDYMEGYKASAEECKKYGTMRHHRKVMDFGQYAYGLPFHQEAALMRAIEREGGAVVGCDTVHFNLALKLGALACGLLNGPGTRDPRWGAGQEGGAFAEPLNNKFCMFDRGTTGTQADVMKLVKAHLKDCA